MATKAEKIAQIEARLVLYRTAEATVLTGAQSYEVEDKRFTRADLEQIRMEIRLLEGDLARLTKKSIIVQRVNMGRR